MMNKQRFINSGCVGFFLFLAMITLLGAQNPQVNASNQPIPVRAPVAISAPAKATPSQAYRTQPAMQPIPQPVPVPTPAGIPVVNSTPAAPTLLPHLLLGLLTIAALSFIVRFARRPSSRRHDNGRSPLHSAFIKGVHS